MKKYLLLAFLSIPVSTYSMSIDWKQINKTVSLFNGVVKTGGITTLGIAGAFGGTYLITRGWKKAFLDKDKNTNKTFLNNNLTRGLFTVGFGTLTTIGSAYLILKSDNLVQRFS